MELGKLEKMRILAFKDDEYKKPAKVPSFPVLVNPESYSVEYAVEYNTDAANGQDGTTARYTRHDPESFSCDLWFDNTGLLDGVPRSDVHADTEGLKSFLFDLESDTHEPRHFMVTWGTMLFKGRVERLQIEYKLFKPDGSPIRAMASVSFVGSFSDLLRIAKNNLLSPDLTHVHTAKAGDTLPNLCEEMYGHPRYASVIARVNGLAGFRYLKPGTELVFPPFNKNTTN